MTKRLVAIDTARDLGAFSDSAIALLLAQLEDNENAHRFYVDRSTLRAFEQAFDRDLTSRFKEAQRERFDEMNDEALSALLDDAFPAIPTPLKVERGQELWQLFDRMLDRTPERHRDAVLAVVFGHAELDTLRTLPTSRRKEMLEDVYALVPSDGSELGMNVERNYNQIALAFNFEPTLLPALASQAEQISQGQDPLHDPDSIADDQQAALGKAVVGTVLDAVIRVVLLSAAPEDRKAVFLDTLDAGWEQRLNHLVDDEYRDELRAALAADRLVERLRMQLELDGASDLVVSATRASHALKVELVAGRSLITADISSSDPYCLLSVADPSIDIEQRYQSTIKGSTLNPEWDESWCALATRGATLRIAVMDRDILSADDPMGFVEIPLSELDDAETSDGWHKLEGVGKGELHLKLTLTSLAALPVDKALDVESADETT